MTKRRRLADGTVTKRDVRAARLVWRFDDGRNASLPLVDVALSHIRQWAALEQSDKPADREAATSALRRMAEMMIEQDFFAADAAPVVANYNAAREGAKEENDKKSEAAKERYAEWQRRADAVWKLHPQWGRPAVAKAIAKDGEKWDTIRKHIRRK